MLNTAPRTFAILVIAGAVASGLLAGCTRETPASPSPTATASPVTGPTTATTTTSTPSPTPTPAFPLATGQAIPGIVSDVVTAVVGKQPAALTPVLAYQQVGCTTAQGAGGPPKCRPGDPQGTVYRVFPTGRCEGEWVTDGAAAVAQIVPALGQLYAAARVQAPNPDPEPYWPKGQSVVVFRGTDGQAGGYFVLDATRVVRAHRICDTAGGGFEALLRSLGTTTYYIAPAQ